MSSVKRMIAVNGVDLCVQTFGDEGQPAVVLISGASTSMDLWPAALCERLAHGGRFVIRYDLRDTGESTTYGAGNASYTLLDLTDDVVALLDALGLDQVQVVGMSMGGIIAQLVALVHPSRVRGLTLVSTSPAVPGQTERELPGMATEDLARFGAIPEADWSDPTSVLEHLVAGERACAARSVPFDEESLRHEMRALVARVHDAASAENHFALKDFDVSQWRLAHITAPTVVLHGDEDPVFPLAHGQALADEIPGARLVVLHHVGHEVPARMWDALEDAVTG
ncbi:MAG: alpha/beta hydrolase [Propionibacteriaceae bacterium]